MKRKVLISLITVLISLTALNAQKTFELDEVDQIPYLDADNMKIIAFTLVDLYKTALETPELFSTGESKKDTVYLFYDTDFDRRYNKVNPRIGEKYSLMTRYELEQNDRLLFNLIFDENGYLVVNEKINVISYKQVEVNGINEQVNLIAFEFILHDSIKIKLRDIKLETTAAVDKNSLTGDLTPVKVLIPFNIDFGYSRSKDTYGTIEKNDDVITISTGKYFRDINEESQLIEFFKANTELMKYKKGNFQFIVEEKFHTYFIDFNIGRTWFKSPQTQSFRFSIKYVKSFKPGSLKLN